MNHFLTDLALHDIEEQQHLSLLRCEDIVAAGEMTPSTLLSILSSFPWANQQAHVYGVQWMRSAYERYRDETRKERLRQLRCFISLIILALGVLGLLTAWGMSVGDESGVIALLVTIGVLGSVVAYLILHTITLFAYYWFTRQLSDKEWERTVLDWVPDDYMTSWIEESYYEAMDLAEQFL